MIAVIFLITALLGGAAAGLCLAPSHRRFAGAWLGSLMGLTLLIWLPVLFGAVTGYYTAVNYYAAGAVLAALGIAIYLWLRKHPPKKEPIPFPPKSFWLMGAGFMVLMLVLYYNHVLMPRDGDLYVGQSTYGDLAMHLGFITSLAEQGIFPPEYNLFPGALLSYPFLIDSLSSGMLLLGLPLSWSVTLPSLACCALLYTGFYLLFLELARSHTRSMLCLLLFLLCGGLGFFYYLDGSAADPTVFTRIFTEYYNAPTNFPEDGLRWVNPICDMLVPQRTTLLGWTMLPAVLFCVQLGLKEKSSLWMLLGGLFAGALPMMHTHTYLACGIVCFGWVLAYAPWRGEESWISYLLRWAAFGVPAIALALPQLFTWTFRQATGDAFVREGRDWVNEGDPTWWFWLKNLGLAGFLFLPALWAKFKECGAVQSGAWLLCILSLFYYFQPNPYDNNKLLWVWYLLCLPATAWYLEDLWHALKSVPARGFLAAAAAVLLFASGTLSVIREVKSGGDYLAFSREDVEMAEYIRENTETDALFVTGRQHLNPVAVLSGRSIWCGTDLYLFFHGLNTVERASELQLIYQDPELSRSIAEKIGADYILLSDHERYNYPGSATLLDAQYERVHDHGNLTLYRVQ